MKKFATVITMTLLTSFFAKAGLYQFSPDQGKVTFLAKGKPALISIRGEGAGVDGILKEEKESISGQLAFQMKTLKTGIELRDEHMKNKYLEVEKFPAAVLQITELRIPGNKTEPFKFQGVMTLHGTQQPIDGEAKLTSGSSGDRLIADFKIQLSKFQIPIASFQGITVAEDVQVTVDLPVVKAQ